MCRVVPDRLDEFGIGVFAPRCDRRWTVHRQSQSWHQREILLIQLVDGVQRGREANPAVPRVRRRNEHVVRQLALHSDVPCKNVGRDSILLEIERIDAGPGTESRAERNGSRKRKYATAPGPESPGGVTRRVALEGAIQQIPVVHGYLLSTLLITAAVPEV